MNHLQDLLNDLNIGPNTHKIPEVAVSLALDRHDPQRELISRLISNLYGCILTQEAMARGFDNLLHSLHELFLDLPAAPEVSQGSRSQIHVSGLILRCPLALF